MRSLSISRKTWPNSSRHPAAFRSVRCRTKSAMSRYRGGSSASSLESQSSCQVSRSAVASKDGQALRRRASTSALAII